MTAQTVDRPKMVGPGEIGPIEPRLAKFQSLAHKYAGRAIDPADRPLVRVVTTYNEDTLGVLGREVRLERIDTNDSRMTFLVGWDANGPSTTWVYDVDPIENEAPVLVPDPAAADIPVDSMDREQRQATKAARIARAGAVGGRVIVETTWGTDAQPAWLWQEVTLDQIDEADPTGTFKVSKSDGSTYWVYQVCPVPGSPAVVEAPVVEKTAEEVLQAEVTRLRNEVSHLEIQRAERDREIAAKAMEYATRHNWCSVVKEALREMDIEPPSEKVSITVKVTTVREFRVISEPTSKSYDDLSEVWIKESINIDSDGEPSLDSDWNSDETEVEVIDQEDSFEVVTFEQYED